MVNEGAVQMRVAVCLSGQMRTFRSCAPSVLASIVRPLGADVFIHTWDEIGISAKENAGDVPDRVDPDELRRIYGAVEVVVEPSMATGTLTWEGVTVPAELVAAEPEHHRGALPLFYKIDRCHQLVRDHARATGHEYDVVIRIRPDLVLNRTLDPVTVADWAADDVLTFEADLVDTATQVSDKFALGSMKAMDEYTALWQDLPTYWANPLGDGTPAGRRVGERLVFHHLAERGLRTRPVGVGARIVRFSDVGSARTTAPRIAPRLTVPRDDALGYVLTPTQMVYYAVPKAACTSLKWQAAELQGEQLDAFGSVISLEASSELTIHDRGTWRFTPTVHEISGSSLEGWAATDEWFRYAVVRDPVARVWSGWQSKILSKDPRFLVDYPELLDYRTPETIDEVIDLFVGFVDRLLGGGERIARDPHFVPQSTLLPLGEDHRARPRIYATSQIGALQQDLSAHLARFGRTLPALRRSNEALFHLPTGALPASTVEALVDRFAVDYDTFDVLARPDHRAPRVSADVSPEVIAMIPHVWDRNARIRDLAVAASRRLGEGVR